MIFTYLGLLVGGLGWASTLLTISTLPNGMARKDSPDRRLGVRLVVLLGMSTVCLLLSFFRWAAST